MSRSATQASAIIGRFRFNDCSAFGALLQFASCCRSEDAQSADSSENHESDTNANQQPGVISGGDFVRAHNNIQD